MEPNTPVPSAPAPMPTQSPVPPQNTHVPSQSSGLEGPISLLKNSWKIFTEHWQILVPIIIAPSIVSYIAEYLMRTGSAPINIVGLVVFIVAMVLSIVSIPAIVQAVHLVSTGSASQVSLRSQYSFGFSLFWSTLLLVVINIFVGIGSFIVLIIPGIIVLVYTSVYTFTFTIDGKKGFAALTESFDLVRGRWFAVFGRFLFFLLIMIVVWLIIAGITAVLSAMGVITDPKSGTSIAQMVISLIGTSIVGPLSVAYAYRMYLSLKSTRTQATSSGFKKWLIACIVVGVLSLAMIPVILGGVVMTSIKNARIKGLEAQRNSEASMIELQRQLEAMGDASSGGEVEIPPTQ